MDHNKISGETGDIAAASLADADPVCISLLDGIQPHIKSRYKRFALISHDEHVAAIDAGDEDTLIVSCNWLIWQKLAQSGRHCVYFELGLLGGEPDETLISELNLRSNDWIPTHDQGDPTIFKTISLARLFSPELSMFLRNYYRLDRSLRKLCDHFEPKEIWFFDYIYDISVVGGPLRKRIVEAIGSDLNITVIDKSGVAAIGEHEIGEGVYVRPGKGIFKNSLVMFYAALLEMTTRLRCLFSKPTRRVLMLLNSNVAEPLVENFDAGLTPVFIGRVIPRKAGLIWRCLQKGILLIQHEAPELSLADVKQVTEIEGNLSKAMATPANNDIRIMREYVRDEILNPGRFRKMAREVLAAERLLERAQPQRVVVDGVRNYPPRIVIELAHKSGIAVDYIWHSTHTPLRQKYEALCGDTNFEPCVDRVLTWGRVNEVWLDLVNGPVERVQVGSPLMNKYTSPDWAPPAKHRAPEDTNVLLLQYSFNLTDFAGLNSNLYEAFVRMVRMLKVRGYRNIKYKLHPGRGRWKKTYFEEIGARFKLDCPILKSEPYKECLAWSDIVIGSALSGAMFETLAAGRPYVAMLLKPNTVNASCYGDFPMYATLDEVPDALIRNIEAEGRRLLEDVYGIDAIANPAKRMWDVLRTDFE